MRIPAILLILAGPGNVLSAYDLPSGVANSQNPQDVSLTPLDSLSRITVPDGFHVTLFAGEPDIRRPIAFDFDDRGRLWVVENYSHPHWKKDNATDRIVILEDTDNDGRFDERKIFYDKGRYLTGIACGHGGVWVANTPEICLIPDRNHDDIPDQEPLVILDGFQISTNNVLNNFHWGPDGWLYGAIGLSSTSMVGPPGAPPEKRTPITRGIWRLHPITLRFEKLAEGMVNPWGADFNEYGDLFTANTVLAHLWHIVPGMYCERRASEQDNPFAYSRIQSITNHLHWGGGQWQASRNPSSQKNKASRRSQADHHHNEEYQQHSVAGGGHAHCGAMIYLGDNWPKPYRGTFFTNNLHGNRVNNDKLVPKRSTYVGTHAADLLNANDPWFRGMQIKYGSDGGVYVSDWHDFGECHDSDGSHRTSGRIYKITFGKTQQLQADLNHKSDEQLAELHTHPNEWFVRHARRILHERSEAGFADGGFKDVLWEMLRSESDVTLQLRALWTLYVIGDLKLSDLSRLLHDNNEHLRRWAVRFLAEGNPAVPADSAPAKLLDTALAPLLRSTAAIEESPKVRLELASVLQRLDTNERLQIANLLLRNSVDTVDPYIPLMIWYGIEPAVPKRIPHALRIAGESKIPLVRRYIARRIADMPDPPLQLIVQAAIQAADDEIVFDLLKGMSDSLAARGSQTAPESWPILYDGISDTENPELRSEALKLATIFGDTNVIENLRQFVLNSDEDPVERKMSLDTLLNIDNGISVEDLHRLIISDAALRSEALQALIVRNDTTTDDVLLKHFHEFSSFEKQQAVSVFATRQDFARSLLNAINKGLVTRADVSAFALQQLRSYTDAEIQSLVNQIWADDRTALEKLDELARLQQIMTKEYLEKGSSSAGRLVFHQTCAKCHTLFDEGGTIAPNLTGSGRKKFDYVLRNLINPSEEIDAAYRLTTVITTDGRLFSGFIVRQDDNWLHIRTQDTSVRLSMKDIDELSTSNLSMMPEGMLKVLSDEQIRDLLVYLRSEEQVPLPENAPSLRSTGTF